MIDIHKKELLIYIAVAILCVISVIYITCCCMYEKEEAITITGLKWISTVTIEQLNEHHRTRQSSCPHDAYNVRGYTVIIGKTFVRRYDYDIKTWDYCYSIDNSGVRSDVVVYAEPNLQENQRISDKTVKYTVDYKDEDGDAKSSSVSKDIFYNIKDVGNKEMVKVKWYGISELLR